MGKKVLPLTIESFEKYVDKAMEKMKTYPYPFIMDHKKFTNKFRKTIVEEIEKEHCYSPKA